MKRAAVTGLLAVLASIGAAWSQDGQPNPLLAMRLQPGATLDRYLQVMRGEFARLDADGDGKVDQADLTIHATMSGAMMRNSFAMQIMAADLDGDGAVTEDEMRRKMQYDRRNQIHQPANPAQAAMVQQQVDAQIKRWMDADADKDGRVTWQEAADAVKKQPNYGRQVEQTFGRSIQQLLSLAPEGKPSLSLQDLEARATVFFRDADADNNGTISQDEAERLRREASRIMSEQSRLRAMEANRAECEMPKASQAAKVILLGAYETEALSSVALGSQDEVTGVGNISVEPGAEPLYVVIATYRPTIWRFYGALDRIERVVVLSQRGLPDKSTNKTAALGGAVGIPADKGLSEAHELPALFQRSALGRIRSGCRRRAARRR